MVIRKMGKVIEFTCQVCEGVFVAGRNEVREYDGNYYCDCPMCGAECYTNITRQLDKQTKTTKEENDDGNFNEM